MSTAAPTGRQVPTSNDIARELIIRTIFDDELHFVVRREAIEVGPVVLTDLAAAGALDVDDFHDLGRNPIDRTMAARFEQHRPATCEGDGS